MTDLPTKLAKLAGLAYLIGVRMEPLGDKWFYETGETDRSDPPEPYVKECDSGDFLLFLLEALEAKREELESWCDDFNKRVVEGAEITRVDQLKAVSSSRAFSALDGALSHPVIEFTTENVVDWCLSVCKALEADRV